MNKTEIYKSYIAGLGRLEIAEKVNMEPQKVSDILISIPLKLRLDNLRDFRYKLSKGWIQYDKYLLSPDRKNFLKMAQNGLWVKFEPNTIGVNGYSYKRLGTVTLSKIEKHIRKRLSNENN